MKQKPGRFRSAAAHYLEGRSPYPQRLIDHVARFCALKRTDRVMDLGCGPGQIARAFAPYVHAVLGVDPEPAMLAIAKAETADARFSNVTFRLSSSADLAPSWGRFKLITMGRSFHWMDRPATLRALDELIVPGGAVVLFSDDHPGVPANAWVAEFRTLMQHHAKDDAGRSPHRKPGWIVHDAVLLDSPFSRLDKLAVVERRTITAESLVHRALSLSSTSPSRLGDRLKTFLEELQGLLARIAPDGHLTEVLESRAVIATRPGDDHWDQARTRRKARARRPAPKRRATALNRNARQPRMIRV